MDVSFINDRLKKINKCEIKFEGKLEVLFGMEMG